MTPDDFIRIWLGNPLSERASAQSHFRDLCTLIDIDPPSPLTADTFEFEKGAAKTTGGDGWADVWLKDAFAWEYKKTKANLDAAYAQVQRYAPALDNPPLLIVSDTQQIVIRTAFTGAVQEKHDIKIEELRDATKRDLLRRAFQEPRSFKPRKTRADLTEDAAATFADLALRLRQAGHAAQDVAHFVNRLVFCMFAEDVRLLPEKMFEKMVFASNPCSFEENCRALFAAMANRGGRVGFTPIPWFNGGLFDDDTALPVDADDIAMLRKAAKMDWSQIDASLLGTLFERGLDPDKRSQLGAHYTDATKIMQIVEPVVLRPLRAEWDEARATIEAALEEERAAKQEAATTRAAAKAGAATRRANRAHDRAVKAHLGFLERLRIVRVLDPACGSGNFLNLALTALKDLEHRANLDAEALGLPRPAPSVGPECVLGIELNPYAAELARVSTWIAEIQWMRRNGFEASKDPILKPLGTIECADALLEWSEEGLVRRAWPDAEFIVGNPPFLGSKFLRKGKPATRTQAAVEGLGDQYVDALYGAYRGVLPASANLVSYWFANLQKAFELGKLQRAGLVSTRGVLKGASNAPLAALVQEDRVTIAEAWSNKTWDIEGASVRVCLIVLQRDESASSAILDGEPVDEINADLSTGLDLARATALRENRGVCFQGVKQNGTFTISASRAREMLKAPTNPNGKKNKEVLRRFFSNDDVTMRDTDGWIVDFSNYPDYEDAVWFEGPFEVAQSVREERQQRSTGAATETGRLESYWLMQRPRTDFRAASVTLHRVFAVPETSQHLIFRWFNASGTFSGSLFAFATDCEAMFGILHSRYHRAWAARMGNNIGVGDQNRYNKSRTFETFPFPEKLTPDIPAADYAADPRAQAIAAAARELDEKREAWLNPPELVRRESEIIGGYPDRLQPVNDATALALKERTLTNLYNDRPAWLDGLHRRLDATVAAAYGWPEDIAENDALARLLELNRIRADS